MSPPVKRFKAFHEHLCEHCGIVRVGPAARTFGDNYEYSVTYVLRDGYAFIVGFYKENISGEEYSLIIRCINEATKALVSYDRAGIPMTRMVQVDPALTEGRIVMSKEKLHDITKAAKNGKFDLAAVESGIAHFKAQGSHYEEKNVVITKTPTTANGFVVHASWEVVEKNPATPAAEPTT